MEAGVDGVQEDTSEQRGEFLQYCLACGLGFSVMLDHRPQAQAMT